MHYRRLFGICRAIGCILCSSLALGLMTRTAMAQTVEEAPPITIVAPALIPNVNLDPQKLPYQDQPLTQRDLTRTGVPDALGALSDQAAGINLDQAQNNPYQPNLLYHGFEASPLVGDAQGLAVYVNGSRFNQPFGDTTNWDLIPDFAINQIDVLDANPTFGLNALGGSIAVQLKNGFTYHGGELTIFGGSFGRTQGFFQYGKQSGNASAYVGLQIANDNGWRDHSPSHLRQFYGDLGWRSDRAELHLNFLGADNTLVGNGTTPVDLLAMDRAAMFTYPDQTQNKYSRAQFSLDYSLSENSSIQVNAYYSNLSQRTVNGDAAEVETCDDNLTIVCQEDGPPLTTTSGGLISSAQFRNNPYFTEFGIAKFRNGGPFAFLNQTATDTDGYGTQAQYDRNDTLYGRKNHLIVGASYDGGSTEFTASTLLGSLSLDRGFVGPGISIESQDGSISPVRVHAFNNYYGFYATDTLDVTDRLSATASGRFNFADIDLHDELGGDVSGRHQYTHLNPAIGANYKIIPAMSVYAGYATSNRAPTPAELSCADPQSPCSLTNFFVGDPGLKQVVAHTFTVGLRGRDRLATGALNWQVEGFRTTNDDDILFVSSPTIGRAFFRNVGNTRRQGFDATVRYVTQRWQAWANYTFTNATFQTSLVLSSEDNPAADADGNIFVSKGNQLPGVPAHVFKLGSDYKITERWTIGASAQVASGQYLFGDESNQNPKTNPYVVTNIHTSYQLLQNLQVFAFVNNLFNSNYETYGTFSPVTSDTPILQALNSRNTRSLSPAPPVAAYGGVKLTW